MTIVTIASFAALAIAGMSFRAGTDCAAVPADTSPSNRSIIRNLDLFCVITFCSLITTTPSHLEVVRREFLTQGSRQTKSLAIVLALKERNLSDTFANSVPTSYSSTTDLRLNLMFRKSISIFGGCNERCDFAGIASELRCESEFCARRLEHESHAVSGPGRDWQFYWL